ncbi:MAG: MinD/ParA family protein [Arcobacter butzleri]|jgi:flagellar biosynthesis protein FlhG|nr:P-loop NTPase [Arcobacteraceae bacterium]MDY0365557.1 P-loop NTPase [Arcobacteraceae bacterium]NLO16697.1 MinD/ParA family protein [Aliarcobacter butzleri]
MFSNISSQAKNLIDLAKKGTKESKTKILTITSGKGGVGKSTFSANISYLLAELGYKVAILDADIGLANMHVLFDMKPELTFFDYIDAKVDTLEEIILPTPYKNISLIAGKSGYEYSSQTSSFVFTKLVKELVALNKFDILIIDTGAGLNEYVKEFLEVSQNILAITSTDPSALTDVYALMKMLSTTKDRLFLAFNHTRSYQVGMSITESMKNLAQKNRLNSNFMVKYLGNVSMSQNIATTGRLRKLFVREFEYDLYSMELKVIVDNLLINIR